MPAAAPRLTSRGAFSSSGGTLFKVDPRTRLETILHTFTGRTTDGSFPSGLLVDKTGTLYGVTQGGGTSSAGTFYSYGPAGYKLVYSFTGGANGGGPGGLVTDGSGHFYGAASGGVGGLVYELTP